MARSVKVTLGQEGWRVEVCGDGTEALAVIESMKHYDLILLDQDLPGLKGIELVRRARNLAHRQGTLIAMLTGSRCETEALAAGVNLFLKKPEDVDALTEALARLLATESPAVGTINASIRYIYRPGGETWFAYTKGYFVYDREDRRIAVVGEGRTLRDPETDQVIAREVEGMFYTPGGEWWGYFDGPTPREPRAPSEG